jgi:hypothetical protein
MVLSDRVLLVPGSYIKIGNPWKVSQLPDNALQQQLDARHGEKGGKTSATLCG